MLKIFFLLFICINFAFSSNNKQTYISDEKKFYTKSKLLKSGIQTFIDDGPKGMKYWEPDSITYRMNDSWGVGSVWDNITLIDINGNVLMGANYICYPYKF